VSKAAGMCTDCEACGADCAGAADPQGTVRAAECLLCMNCVDGGCPKGALSYGLLPLTGVTAAVSLGRRRCLSVAASAFAAVPLLRASDPGLSRPDPKRIRPPGALDEDDFLARCLKCGACMKACPTGGLQPALAEAGLLGLWSPVLVPRQGWCEQACVLCGQVCPTGAIRTLSLAEKVGEKPYPEPVRIGSAAFDKGRCLPWANDTECIVCEEVCPTPEKAIYLKLETVTLRDGSQKTLKRPYVDLKKCVGCGICEARCPVFDLAGVRVSAVGETRSTKNRVILSGRV
jgi:formate hydrogenlyase subunit 6/NADH:ubiquinone oxidoreductase subunit I